jgi:hypothetical protein
MEGESQGLGRVAVGVTHSVVVGDASSCADAEVMRRMAKVIKGRKDGILTPGGWQNGNWRQNKC